VASQSEKPLVAAPLSLEALRGVIEALPDAVLVIDRDWRLLYANQTSQRISRIPPEALHGTTLWEFRPNLAPQLSSAYREVMELREERSLEAFYYPPFNAWYDIRILPVDCGIVVCYQDVTAMKKAERLRDAATTQLREVLEASTEGVTCVDRKWRITYMNPVALKHVASQGNPVGEVIWDAFPSAYREGSPYVEHYYRAMNEGIGSVFEAFYPEPINIWFRLSVKPSPNGIILFAQDVTEQKHALKALVQSEKLAAAGRLASSIAHRFNNPLEAVTNLLYLARLQAERPETQGYLDMAEQELRRVSIVASQVLRFHRQTTRPQQIDCTDLFSTLMSIYERRLKNAHIAVEIRERARVPIRCFEGEIGQVLANFVDNAVDAMPNGGRLLIRSRQATDWRTGRSGLVLTVADTGSGIDSKAKAQMFEAFFTTKDIASTGLGLWVSAEIVERHHGRILVRSRQTRERSGTVMALFLPFSAD
jgi:signal transduction histidine kinase